MRAPAPNTKRARMRKAIKRLVKAEIALAISQQGSQPSDYFDIMLEATLARTEINKLIEELVNP